MNGQTEFRYIQTSPKQIGLTGEQLGGLNQKYTDMVKRNIMSNQAVSELVSEPAPQVEYAQPISAVETNMFDATPTQSMQEKQAPIIPETPLQDANTNVFDAPQVEQTVPMVDASATQNLTNAEIIENIPQANPNVDLAQSPTNPVVQPTNQNIGGMSNLDILAAQFTDIINNQVILLTKMQAFANGLKALSQVNEQSKTVAPANPVVQTPTYNNVFEQNPNIRM